MRETLLRYFFVGPDGARAYPVGRAGFMRVGREWDSKYGKKNWTVLDRAELVHPRGKQVEDLGHVDTTQTA